MSDTTARLALGLLGLWRERPAGVRHVEATLYDVLDGRRPSLSDADVTALFTEVARLEEIRALGPFVAPVDRSVLAEVAHVVGG